ncbi:uncharacterized protein CLUP02_15364 [Colletotrichum lupini]|uniref:Uncharacterized protein n=1 Tax=Colletotrichum lupini TaxID=145971 RepID=A0A9Q8T5X8_9PEZI|nr:uncharacterized protein CLUP02_15364 [Colletotrichum lupini]UQC89833.1 hypothetical protein CLUP02_15364 [Colletotrichum lupini]
MKGRRKHWGNTGIEDLEGLQIGKGDGKEDLEKVVLSSPNFMTDCTSRQGRESTLTEEHRGKLQQPPRSHKLFSRGGCNSGQHLECPIVVSARQPLTHDREATSNIKDDDQDSSWNLVTEKKIKESKLVTPSTTSSTLDRLRPLLPVSAAAASIAIAAAASAVAAFTTLSSLVYIRAHLDYLTRYIPAWKSVTIPYRYSGTDSIIYQQQTHMIFPTDDREDLFAHVPGKFRDSFASSTTWNLERNHCRAIQPSPSTQPTYLAYKAASPACPAEPSTGNWRLETGDWSAGGKERQRPRPTAHEPCLPSSAKPSPHSTFPSGPLSHVSFSNSRPRVSILSFLFPTSLVGLELGLVERPRFGCTDHPPLPPASAFSVPVQHPERPPQILATATTPALLPTPTGTIPTGVSASLCLCV